MKIGVLTASISRQAGGLFWAVRSLAEGVKRAGCEINVFSVADSFSDEDAAQWRGLDLNVLPRRGPEAFSYAPGLSRVLDEGELDLMHSHGLWMYPSVAALRWSKRWDRPLVVSPHGMLDPWAVQNSAWKKHLAGYFYENAHLCRTACLHALNRAEADAMRAYGLNNPIAVVPNGIDLPGEARLEPPSWRVKLPKGAKALLFLSRIHPKKGIPSLLQAWKTIEFYTRRDSWHLVIAGWDQGGHERELKTLSQELGIDKRVHFIGSQFGEDKASTFQHADAFILPSLSEGLPMVVLEAWAYGLPVLMTDECNIPDGFTRQAAIRLSLEIDEMADTLKNFIMLREDEKSRIGQAGKILVQEKFTWEKVSADMIDVYRWVLGKGLKPDCVVCD